MGWKRSRRSWIEVGLVGLVWLGLTGLVNLADYPAAMAQTIATTTVTDTVYRADGTGAAGTVLVSWQAFSTISGASVPAGSTSVTLGAGGALSVALVANAGSEPIGTYYTVVYHLDDGSVTREYWVVPVSTVAGGGECDSEHGASTERGGADGEQGVCGSGDCGGCGWDAACGDACGWVVVCAEDGGYDDRAAGAAG